MYPFLLWNRPSIDHSFRHIEFVSIWWSCLVVFRLHGNDANVWGLLFSDFLFFFLFFFLFLFFTPPTDPKSGKSMDNKRIKRGWPELYGFFLVVLTALLLCISVFLSFVCFVLFCFVFFSGEINWNGNLFPDLLCLIPFLRFSSTHIKIKSAGIYWPQWQWGGVRARYCASVHSQAVKWSKTQGKTSVDILFTSRHQVSLMMELIASPCPRIRVESRCWR